VLNHPRPLPAYPVHAILSSLLCALILKTTSISRKRNPNGLPLPPGPKGFPVIGNLLDMPADKLWLEWSKTYGKSFLRLTFPSNYFIFSQMTWCKYFQVLGQPFLVLDTLRRTNDLFDKRSTNYSDRMRMLMVLEL